MAVLKLLLKSLTVEEWISRDTNLLTKVQLTATAAFAPNTAVSAAELQITVLKLKLVATFYDFGQVVQVSVPPEALNAPETPLPK